MLKSTKEALLKSIEHWRENENIDCLAEAKMGAEHCALCHRFDDFCARTNADGDELERCPVFKYAHFNNCNNTPYYGCVQYFRWGNLDGFKKYAKLERKFLEGLLPAKKKKKS